MRPKFTVEPLGRHHNRAVFSSGNDLLDDYIRTKARKENDLGYSAVFILVEQPGSSAVAGYYTLSSHSVVLQDIDPTIRSKLPRYPSVPTTLIGRLARDLRFRGSGAGEFLLMDALQRALHNSRQVGSFAVTVDAIDAAAMAFYARYGFRGMIGHEARLYLPMASIEQLRH